MTIHTMSSVCGRPPLSPQVVKAWWARVSKSDAPNGCWLWMGEHGRKGYGRLRIGRRRIQAHRLALLVAGSEIPKGYHVDHMCCVVDCVNPAHLRAVPAHANRPRRARR